MRTAEACGDGAEFFTPASPTASVALNDVPPDLVRRCRAGEQRAFDQLFGMIHQDLFRWAFSMLRNEEDALDVTQECMTRIFRHLPNLKEDAKFPGWASRLLMNQVNTFRVKRKKNQTDEWEDGYDTEDAQLPMQGKAGANPRKAAEKQEVYRQVNEAIAELPTQQRLCVLMFDVQNRSIKEIATELECSEGAVKFNIFQGRRKLREALGHYVDADGNLNLTE